MIEAVATATEGIERLRNSRFDTVVIVTPIPEWSAENLLDELARLRTGVPIVVCDSSATVPDAARYVRLGAHDVVGAVADLPAMLESALEFRRGQRAADGSTAPMEEPWRKFLVGSSHAMLRTTEVIRLVAGRRSTVLITGETGTGKEMVARAIHMASPRAQRPMVAVNCTALPEHLLEAELFGHVKGAVTGAIQHRMGHFEQANHGTLFLDEVGDLPLDIQAKLLRVLQEREFQRIGSSETIRVDVRVIAATNVDLVERIRDKGFREDLYYRLNVVPIWTPPLRERLEDIPMLVHHFIAKICRQEDIPLRRVVAETLARLAAYPWPGNVRQLENEIERVIAMSGSREVLYPSDFAFPASRAPKTVQLAGAAVAVPEFGLDFEQTVGGSSARFSRMRSVNPAATRPLRRACSG